MLSIGIKMQIYYEIKSRVLCENCSVCRLMMCKLKCLICIGLCVCVCVRVCMCVCMYACIMIKQQKRNQNNLDQTYNYYTNSHKKYLI